MSTFFFPQAPLCLLSTLLALCLLFLPSVYSSCLLSEFFLGPVVCGIGHMLTQKVLQQYIDCTLYMLCVPGLVFTVTGIICCHSFQRYEGFSHQGVLAIPMAAAGRWQLSYAHLGGVVCHIAGVLNMIDIRCVWLCEYGDIGKDVTR